MAIALRSTTTTVNTTTTTSHTVSKPSGVVAGDVLVVSISCNGNTMSTVPTDWVKIYDPATDGGTVANPKLYGYYLVVTSSHDAISSWTWTTSGAIASSLGCAAYTGVDTTTPIDVAMSAADQAAGTTLSLASVTTTVAGTMLVSAGALNSSNVNRQVNEPTGFNTERWDLGGKRHAYADMTVASAGAIGAQVWGFPDGYASAGWMVPLRPASSGGPGDVTAVVATATSQEGTPVVTGEAVIVHDTSTGSATSSAPTVSAAATVTAVRGQGSSAAIAPAVTGAQTATVTAVRAQGSSTAIVPAVTVPASVASVSAQGSGTAIAPAVSAEQTATVAGVRAQGSSTAIAPVVTVPAPITSVRAQGTSTALAPVVTGDQAITAVSAQGTALAPAPAVFGEQTASVEAVPATATASSTPPVVDTPASVAAVVAQGSSTAIAPAVSNGVGGTPFENISDTFADGTLAAIWSSSYGDVSEAGGHGRILSNTGFPAFKTAAVYTLADSHVIAQAWPAIKGTSTGSVTSEMLIDSPTGGTRLLIIVNTGTDQISFRNDVGYGDGSGVTITYDATAHAWWRIRETAGTVYMDTAPDGLTWTNRRSFATPAWVSNGNNPLVFSTHRSDGDLTHYFEFDNFNSAPTAVPGDVSAVPATGSSAAVAPVVGGGAVVVALASTATATEYAPGISAGLVVLAPDATATGDAHDPSVSAGTVLLAPGATASGDMLDPDVSVGSGVSAPGMLATVSTPEPVVTSAATIQSAPTSANAQATPPTVSVTAGGTVGAPAMQATTAMPEPVAGTAATIQSVRATAGAQASPPAVTVVVALLAMRMVATATAQTPGISVEALVNAVAALATAIAQTPRLGGDSELYLRDGTRVLPFLLIGGILVPVDTQF